MAATQAKTDKRDDDLGFVHAGLGEGLDTLLVYSLLRTHSYLSPSLDADLRRQNLTAAQLNALLVLQAAGPDGLLMNEIGQALVVTKSNVTGLVDRLERQGLVVRAEREDRRATAVRLTPAASRLLDTITPRHTELLRELTDCLTTKEKQTLIQLLSKLRKGLRERRRKGGTA